MAQPRTSVRLSTDEAWQLVAESHTGIFVTLRADGVPIATPMWFAVLDRQIYVQTPKQSKKVARLRRDPRVSFLVESGERWAELRAVHITGQAEFVDDPTTHARVAAEMERKYTRFRTGRAAMPDATRRHYETPFVLIRVAPDEHIISWDNRKLRDRRLDRS
ncbi:MAG: TIGR03618 family F420-dependent PPOX class oxidoreductase [Deltaproteobacteria bacterium]|nr:TIGR03618 family F420-dependent PPOX class oxidoreductase [Deltaproteobacteria bacterium]MBI3386950.1 TIGR03618 family F420-dependent PPOX class oxidoreductase [Deltaproteobacteria bacterium]